MTDMLSAPAWGEARPNLALVEVPEARPTPRRKARGLRLTVVPAWSLIGQVVGAVAALAGVFLLAGIAVALLVAGIVLVAVSTLHEAGLLSAADKT